MCFLSKTLLVSSIVGADRSHTDVIISEWKAFPLQLSRMADA